MAKAKKSFVLELILLAVGVWLILENYGYLKFSRDWPFIIISAGVLVFIERIVNNIIGKRRDSFLGIIFAPENFISLFGLIALADIYGYIKINWALIIGGILILLGLVMIIKKLFSKPEYNLEYDEEDE